MWRRRLQTVLMGDDSPDAFIPIDVPQAESDELIVLYNATNGGAWTNSTNWLIDTTVNNWYGITVSGGHVTEIDLPSNNVIGDATGVDLSVFATNMTFFRITHSDVELSFSQFVGFTAITRLDVGPSVSHGSLLDIASLTTLVKLDLDFCTLTAGVLGDLAALTLLSEELGLSTCIWPAGTHDISTLAALTLLTDLRIHHSNFSVIGDLAALTTLTSMEELYVGPSGDFTVSGPTGVDGMTGLALFIIERSRLGQAELDQVLADLYAGRMGYTAPAPVARINGQTDEASGIYQDATPPTTGKEFIYKLANDPDADGFNTWSIQYTEGGVKVVVP